MDNETLINLAADAKLLKAQERSLAMLKSRLAGESYMMEHRKSDLRKKLDQKKAAACINLQKDFDVKVAKLEEQAKERLEELENQISVTQSLIQSTVISIRDRASAIAESK